MRNKYDDPGFRQGFGAEASLPLTQSAPAVTHSEPYIDRMQRHLPCLTMARETWVQSQVKSYQRLKKWYLMPACFTLSINDEG